MQVSIITPDDVQPGVIQHNDLCLNPTLPLDDQHDELKEDLLLVEFPNVFALAVGWFPSFQASGDFLVALNGPQEDWNPLLEKRCRSIPEQRAIVKEFVQTALRGRQAL